ncbi:hypothetical protein CI109_106063 [Kwoniella shandongensis]|uniref:Uncharacterized protein n=1 Tax=Kwoniella shandongensis TaxID=1734106 RepID=A0A5M6BY14_9TREE|nr:uncharacterized protein CI109_003882 [Kwoniella shandongensis]KAA5527623.1 hypothetical protein CI109_003882 [Kwoniella shandongensis]
MPIAFPRQPPPPHHSHSHTSTSSLHSYPSSIDDDSDASSSEASDDTEAEMQAMIQEEWEESLRQMEVVLSIIIIPTFAKWYGRKFAYFAFARYQQIGSFSRTFFGL